jgi:DNA-binding transcriptional LysR family regulator
VNHDNFQYFELRDLRFFETIAEHGHLTRAARQLYRSQPALTKCVHRLEEALNTKLFERSGRGLRLTATGKLLLARAARLRQGVEEAISEIDDFTKGASGRVRIGSGALEADFLLPEICRELFSEAPGVSIEVVIGLTNALRDGLKEGKIDMVIGPLTGVSSEFETHLFAEDVVVVAACKTHDVFRQKKIGLEHLAKYRWLLALPTFPARQWLDHVFEIRGLQKPVAQMETNSVPIIARLVEKTKLLTFISRHNLGKGRRASELREVPLKETTMRRKLGVICRRDGYLSPAARRFLELVTAKGPELFSAGVARH